MRKNGIVNKYEYVKEKITMDNKEKALLCHKEWNGKLETVAKSKVKTREDLAIAYTPGVAEPCKVIAEDKTAAYTYTWKANTVAVVSDGSAVLGLGNIGPYAAMPVMEGKCVLFKEFGNVNAVPICLDTQDTEEIIQAVKNIAPGFGGINLEDISAPRCFEIEERLKEMLDIPVFHDDQHGTAIVVLAGIINGLRVTGKKKEDCRVVVNGAGSAGVAITKLLLTYGFKHVTMCDREGIKTREDLAIAYTPGVAEPCKVIAEDKTAAYTYTWKANTVAVVSDGSAVLGLGNIGPYAAMPVMEGKCVLFKEFGNVNAVPICLDTQDTEEIIQAVKNIAPGFGGINLEDISAPRCFEIEERLKEMLDIPVFHDDQHGTAIVVLAGIINGLRVTGKKKEDCRVVVNGAGSAGVAITKLLLTYGFKHVTMCDREGIIGKDYPNLNWMQKKMTEVTNLENTSGTLADALRGADIFVGVSAPNIVTPEMVSSMNKDAILFAMANPVPEIMPDVAKAAGAKVVGTGRSDFPNQVNNVIAFPGIFRGALEAHATQITEEMKLAAAEALAALVSDEELNEDFIMPEAFDPRVAEVVTARCGYLCRCLCAKHCHSGNGFFHEQRCHPVCHGKSGAGDHAGCGQSCRSKSCRNRTERFPKSGKQRDRFPWYFPRCIGGTCHPDHRRNETCSSRSTCRPGF